MESDYNDVFLDSKVMIDETLKLFNNASTTLKHDIWKELILNTVIFVDNKPLKETSSEDKLHVFLLIVF